MKKHVINLGVILILIFLFETIWPLFSSSSLVRNMVKLFLIAIPLFLYYKEYRPASVRSAIGKGALMGLLGGTMLAIFFFIYVNLIDTNYVYDLTRQQMEFLEDRGVPVNRINGMINSMGFMRKYHLDELRMIVSVTFRCTIISLILGPMMIERKDDLTLTTVDHEA